MKAAVIGIGNMGRHHARVYAQMPDVELVAMADPSILALEAVAGLWGAAVYLDPGRMLVAERPDIVSIAAPTSQHCSLTTLALAHHCHVLVEKPIAPDVVQAKSMIAMAKVENKILAVGHIERCNPIVRGVRHRMGGLGRIHYISTRRSGPPPPQEPADGVLLDLAIHDLDIMAFLLETEPVAYSVMAQRIRSEQHEDMASAIIEFGGGTVGALEVDRVSAIKQRTFTVAGERGQIYADYMSQNGWLFNQACREELTVWREEPLVVELRNFAAAVRIGGRPAATGEDGLRALEMVMALLASKGDRSSNA